ncbi:MAG: 4Fe-4S binding protein [Acidimicrobiia bacterium]
MKWIACSDRIDWTETALDVSARLGWCRDPVVPSDIDEVGFIGCAEDLDRAHLERRLRSEGFDPLGVPIVLLTKLDRDSPSRITARVEAIGSRMAAYTGSRPEHLKPVMHPTLSRRSFLTFRSPTYRAVPHPDDSCCAGDGCRACVDVCPHRALVWSRGAIQHDRLECESCGRCISTCPSGAMVNPAFTPAQLHAEIEGLASAVAEPFGVRIACDRRPRPEMTPGWYEMGVPCVGMLPPHWIIGPLLMGAAAVAVSECGCDAEPDADQRAGEAVVFARSWLDAAGIAADSRIVDELREDLVPALGVVAAGNPFAPDGAVIVAAALGDVLVEGDQSPIGVVTIFEAACTGCEMCSTVCPTLALRAVPNQGGLEIDFDPAHCTACRQCTDRCPEDGAIHVLSTVDSREIAVGRRTLIRHELAECRRCGGTVAPQAALARIAGLLGDDPRALQQITSLCLDCRGATMVF